MCFDLEKNWRAASTFETARLNGLACQTVVMPNCCVGAVGGFFHTSIFLSLPVLSTGRLLK
jgi:hypothetical protein